MTFKDKPFCNSDCVNYGCDRNIAWLPDDLPEGQFVSWSYLSPTCKEYEQPPEAA